MNSPLPTCPRINVLGVGISALNRPLAVKLVVEAVQRRQRGYICVTGVHGVMESYDDEQVRAIHNRALLVTPDGMPMVWVGKLQGHREMGRVYGPDLMLDVCEASGRHGFPVNDNDSSLSMAAIVVMGSLKIWSHFENTRLLLNSTLRRS